MKPCILGESLSPKKSTTTTEEDCIISRIVAQQIIIDEGKLPATDNTASQGQNVRIFPVMSNDETSCSQHYSMNFQQERVDAAASRTNKVETMAFSAGVAALVSPKHGHCRPSSRGCGCMQYRSHYLLQIEPVAQLPA